MQVPETFRKGVVFLYCMRGGTKDAAGTGYVAAFRSEKHPDDHITLLLTAQHVIADIRRQSDDGKVLLRVNQPDDGEAIWIETSVDDWENGDPSVDCAILDLQAAAGDAPVEVIGWNMTTGVATNDFLREGGYGIGDEVFIVGLFRNHLGRDRNEPIVRLGNIAAIPTDPIRTREFGDMRAILIEARSIGGLSGSPVFIHLGYSRYDEEADEVKHFVGSRPFAFLGLIHGHWDALETEVDLLGKPEKLNMGIAVVVPAEQVMASIKDFVEARMNELDRRLDDEASPTLDALPIEPDESTEYERFENLTRKVVQVPKAELDAERKEDEASA